MKNLVLSLIAMISFSAVADVYLIDGVRVEGEVHEMGGMKTICNDEMCMMIPEDAIRLDAEGSSPASSEEISAPKTEENHRLAQGFMTSEKFLAFLKGEEEVEETSDNDWIVVLLIAFLGGLAMNLTPCVLPMIPINLMIIGKSAARGAWYGLGIALAYGAMGLMAAIGGMAFGEIQANPYFNLAIAVLFILLALALSGVFAIDLSKNRAGLASKRQTMLPWAFALFMGVVSAVLAGACVAPILISTLLLTAKLYAGGNVFALALPFVLGLGMALPWPFLGAGLKVLPKPGNWMKYVNKLFAALVFAFALWYGYLAYLGFSRSPSSEQTDASVIAATPSTFTLEGLKRPVLVDCWATWCKNCAAMEETVFKDREVVSALEGYTVIRLQAEDIRELKQLEGFEKVLGLPAFLIIEEK